MDSPNFATFLKLPLRVCVDIAFVVTKMQNVYDSLDISDTLFKETCMILSIFPQRSGRWCENRVCVRRGSAPLLHCSRQETDTRRSSNHARILLRYWQVGFRQVGKVWNKVVIVR